MSAPALSRLLVSFFNTFARSSLGLIAALVLIGATARGEDTLFYGPHSAGTVTPLNGATGAAGSTLISGLSGSHDIARTPQGDFVVALASADRVSKYSASGSLLASRLFTVTAPTAVAVGHDGVIYVASGSRVSKYSATGALVTENFVTNLNAPVDLAIDYKNENLYIVQKTGNRVTRHKLATGAIDTAWQADITAPQAVALAHDGRVYVAAGSTIKRYTLPAIAADAGFVPGVLSSPTRLAFGNNSNRLYVGLASGLAGLVSLDPATGALGNILAMPSAGDAALAVRESGAQSIHFPQPADVYITALQTNLFATSTSGLPVRFELVAGSDYANVPVSSDALNPSTLFVPKAVGTVTVRAIQDGDGQFSEAATVERTFAIVKEPQTITFPVIPDATVNGGPVLLTASASSGLSVTYSIVAAAGTGTGTVSGSLLRATAPGTIVVEATQAGDDRYAAAAAVQRTAIAAKQSQTITFEAIPDQTFGAAPFAVNASSSVGLPVTVSVSSGPATISGSIVTLTGIGAVELTATQTGNSSYDAAAPVVRSFNVLSSSQTITFPSQALTFGGTITLSATATSGLPVTFTLISGPGTLNGNLLTATGVGTIVVEASQAGNANVAAAPAVQTSFTVGQKGNVINFPEIADTTFGAGPVSLFATATSGLPITYSVVSGPANVAGSTLQITGGGTVVVRASQNGNGSVTAATPVERSFKVAKAAQTIDFPQPSGATFSGSSIVLSATSSSGLPVIYSLDSGLGSISGSNLTPAGAGEIVIRATQPGNASYLPATAVLRTIVINRAAQTITFGALIDRTFATPAPSFNLGATAGSGLPVSFEVVSGPATLQGQVLTLTGAGTVVVRASQAGNDNYLAAPAVERSFNVAKADQNIVFEPVATRTFSDVPVALGASATSGLAVAYEIVSGPAAIEEGQLSLKGAGTVVVRASQAGNDNFFAAASVERTITVAKASQVITFPAPSGILFTDPAFDLAATSSSGLAVTFTLVSGPASLVGNTLTPTGTGTVIVRASQAGNDNYLPAGEVQRSFSISAADQTITFPEFAAATYGDAPITLSAFASSGLPVSFSLVSGPGALSGNTLTITGAGSIVIRARQAGNRTAYRAAEPVERTLVVAKAPQTITFPAIADRLFSPSATTISATSSSGLPVGFAFVSGPATLSGNQVTPTGTGTVVLEATQAGNDNYLAAEPVRRSFAIDAAPATVTLGGLERTYTGAPIAATATTSPAGLEVALAYRPAATPAATPSATPPTAAGSYLVTATVTTEGSIGSATGTLVIAKAPLTVTANDAVKLVGTANPPLSFTYSGFLGSDNESVLVATPVVSTTAANSSAVGEYPVTVAGGGAANYALVYVPGKLRVITYSGPYEALLFTGAPLDDARSAVRLPVGRLELTVPASGADFTGRVLLAGEASPLTVKGRFALSENQSAALATVTLVGKPATNRYTLTVSLAAGGLSASLRKGETLVGESDAADAVQLFVSSRTNPAPWSGAHTLILDEAFPVLGVAKGTSLPAGSGYATARIGVDGVLTLAGRLPDGTTLSGTARAGVDGSYRVFVKPYGSRLDSYLAGSLKLALHPDINNRYRSTEDSAFLWTKAAGASDANYRAGIPALSFARVALDPWQPPAAKTPLLPAVTLTERLGLAGDGFLQIEFDLPGETATALPALGELDASNKVLVEGGAALGWSLAVAPATGLVTGKVTFRDPSGTKTVSRSVAINGILRQATKAEVASGDALLGSAQLRIPALGATPATTGALRLYTPPSEK